MAVAAADLTSRTDQITAHSTAVVCQDADLRGTVTIGAGVVVHPKAAIYGLGGGIVLGEDCIVEEGATIVNRTREVMVIGKGCHFMVGCSGSSFLPKSFSISADL